MSSIPGHLILSWEIQTPHAGGLQAKRIPELSDCTAEDQRE